MDFLNRESGLIRRYNPRLRIGWRGESGQVEMRAEIGIVVTQVG